MLDMDVDFLSGELEEFEHFVLLLHGRNPSPTTGWDLREFILEAVYLRCKTEWNRDLALYVMLHIALLPEAEVASFMEIEPGTAFTRANRFRKQFESNEDVRLQTRRCIDSIVDCIGN